jgi:hypothetical protein
MLGQRFELEFSTRIVAIDGLDEAHRPVGNQVFEMHFRRTTPVLAQSQETHLRQMRKDELFTVKSR